MLKNGLKILSLIGLRALNNLKAFVLHGMKFGITLFLKVLNKILILILYQLGHALVSKWSLPGIQVTPKYLRLKQKTLKIGFVTKL